MKIEVVSYGQHKAEQCGSCPIAPTGRFTIYQQLEFRVLPDPHLLEEFAGRSGLEQNVAEYVLQSEEARALLPIYWDVVVTLIELASKQRFTGMRLAFMCGGGFQRSVAVAEYFTLKLQDAYPAYEVSIRHLGLEEREIIAPPSGQPKGKLTIVPA